MALTERIAVLVEAQGASQTASQLGKIGQAAKQAGTATEKGAADGASALGKLAERAGVTAGELKAGAAGLAAGLLGSSVISFFGDSISAASDLNETLSKTNNVFGANAAQVVAWSKTAATSFGLSQQAALAAASQFGDMFAQLGFGKQQAAQTSESIIKLAADLGSFHNVDPSDVLERIGGALRGEYDSLQQLIPNISAATVQQEALAETHKSSVNDLTAAEKATATLAIIQRDGANAANDFAETSGGLANQQRILAAEAEDLKAQIGQALLPAMSGAAKVASQDLLPALKLVGSVVSFVVDEVSSVPGPVLAAAAAFGLIVKFRSPLASTLETAGLKALYFRDSLSQAAGSAEGFVGKTKAIGSSIGSSFGRLVTSISPATAVFGVATAGLGLLAIAQQNAAQKAAEHQQRIESLTSALKEDNGAVGDNTKQLVAKQLADQGAFESAKQLGISQKDLLDAVLGQGDALKTVNGILGVYASQTASVTPYGQALTDTQRENGKAAIELSKVINGTGGELDAATTKYQDIAAATADSTDATKDNTGAVQDNADAVADAKQKLDDFKQALDGVANTNLSAWQATTTYNESLAEAQKTAGDANATYSDQQKALQDLAGDSLSLRDALIDQGASTAVVSAKTATLRQNFIDTALKMGLTKGEASALADQMGLIPKDVTTNVNAPGAKTTKEELNDVISKALGIPPGRTVNVGALTSAAIAKLQAMGVKVRTLPDGTVEITANTDTANGEISALINKPRSITIPVFTTNGGAHLGTLGYSGMNAHGGSVTAGLQYVVGENGPETFVPSTNGTIKPTVNGFATDYSAESGGAAMPPIVIQLEMDGQRVAQVVHYWDAKNGRR